MKLSDLVRRELICLDIESTEKTGSIVEMAESFARARALSGTKGFSSGKSLEERKQVVRESAME